ncbi:MAG: DUF1648 domain-containing protein [Methylocystaceae bacterium]
MIERMNRCYPAWLNLVPLIITFFSVLYVIATYDQLPTRVATHFNFQGQPDNYGSRASITILPILGLVTTIGMSLINILAIMRPEDPQKVFNLDAGQKAALGIKKLENMRVLMARSLFVITALTTLMMSYGAWGEVRVALGLQSGLGIWMMVLAGALLIVCLYMVVKAVGLSLTTPVKK